MNSRIFFGVFECINIYGTLIFTKNIYLVFSEMHERKGLKILLSFFYSPLDRWSTFLENYKSKDLTL
jgi:hypothetical protein